LCDAFQVPKPLSPQLQPFGKSDDDLGELTFEVGLLFCSVRASRTVRGVQADGPHRTCSLGVLRVLARLSLSIRRDFEFWLDGVSDGPQQRADGPRMPSGQSACSPRTVRFSRFASGGSVGFNGQSAAQAGRSAVPVRIVRGTLADGPRGPCGQSALPGRTVRQIQCALLLGSIPPTLSRASACASRNRS
jgi:hypothetical protein